MPGRPERAPTSGCTPSRRAILGGLAATGLAAVASCGKDDEGANPGRPSPTPAPDAVLVAAVVADKRALLARYRATVERHPGLAGRLAPLRADHLAHLLALDAPPEPTAEPTPTGLPTPGAGTVPTVPAGSRAAAAALSTAEQDAADRRVEHCVRARSRDLARLLAAVGGCEAAHSFVLTELAASLPAPPKTPEKPAARRPTAPAGTRAGAR